MFNDPFDCHFSVEPKFDLVKSTEKLRERYIKLLFQNDEPSFTPENIFAPHLRALRQAVRGKNEDVLKSIIAEEFDKWLTNVQAISIEERERWKREAADYRLFCVCEIKDNLLLWSQYTACHTGAVFQFECIEELDVPLSVAKPVIYAEEAPGFATEEEWINQALALTPLPATEGLWEKLVTTKARVWEHEKEWRVVSKRREYETVGYEDCEFDPKEISRVFLGCKMSEADRAEMLQLLTGPFRHVEIYQANQSPTMFRLEFQKIR